MSASSDGYLIGQLAKQARVKPDTIRYYEKLGLLPPPVRTASAYRLYGGTAVKRLRFIRQAQSLGFSLAEIKRILSLRGRGAATCRCVIAMAEASLAETERKLRELHAFHERLNQAVVGWRKSAVRRRRCPAEFCDLIEGLPDGDTPVTLGPRFRRMEAESRIHE